MSNYLIKYFLLLFGLILLPQIVQAQLDEDYFVADKLLRQQKFDQAEKKFRQLHQEHPQTYIFLDKLTECLINLKEYDEAIAVTQQSIKQGMMESQALIRLAEIYHTQGNNDQAFKIWDQVLDKTGESQQGQLRVARSMKERKAYDEAIKIYKKINQSASTSSSVATELAETYLQAGKYEQAIREYLEVVKQQPDRMSFVQRRLIRFQDDYIYDVAILEISDFLEDLSSSHPSYLNLQQLEIWLLMERGLFKRAFVTAKDAEIQSSTVTYTLYNIGSKLLAEQKFELAEQAYSYYIDNNVFPLKNRSREELANVYLQWAKYLESYNLGLSSKRRELYDKAFSTLESLRKEAASYQRLDHVLLALSELSLDILHEPKKASQYLAELRSVSEDAQQVAQEAYIQGRLHLYDQDYTRARIAFSKSNKQERIGELAEKTRYYLALTDFYAGDYEFAKIQLNALERQNTSYFANDAVQLRLWIQNGLQADSSGAKLKPFAKSVELFAQGKDQLGINKLMSLLQKDRYNPMIDEALLELSTYHEAENASFVYRALSSYLKQQAQTSPLYERLLWERARLADQFVTNDEIEISFKKIKTDTLSIGEQFLKSSEVHIPSTIEQLSALYEELLIHFPNGFYATYARERLQELERLQT